MVVNNGPEYTPEQLADPEFEPWYPDFPSDCVRIVPCGDDLDPAANGPFCSYHREPVELSDLEFEYEVNNGRSWS